MTSSLRPAALQDAIESDRAPVLLDVRLPLDYTDAHLPAATLVPRRMLEFRLPSLVPCRSTPLVVCDQRGDRAAADTEWLEFFGYTDVFYMEGGVDAWRRAGGPVVEARDGVPTTALHVESKRFGEQVLVDEDVPTLSPDELHGRLADTDEDVLIFDVRTLSEYRDGAIPGAINAEGIELPHAVANLRECETVVVNCAGRTRSIIGVATLQKLGFPDVYELKNGTMGWMRAGYDLDSGTHNVVGQTAGTPRSLATAVESLLDEIDVGRLSPSTFADLLERTDKNVYSVDVRTREEYVLGHVPGTLSIPGGQAIQRADHYVPDRHGQVAFVSNDVVRAAVTAYWFFELGFPNIAILNGGIEAWAQEDRPICQGRDRPSPLGAERARAAVSYVDSAALDAERSGPGIRVVDMDTSGRYRHGHVPGAEWIPRYHLDDELGGDFDDVVLTCRNGEFSTMAAAALAHRNRESPSVLAGGLAAWKTTGLPVETGESDLSRELGDAIPAPWSLGDEAVRAYLSWEEGLVGDDR